MRLIEIIVVVVVVIFLLATMINSYQQFLDRSRMNAAVEDTITLIQKARSNTLAAKGNYLYGIHFDINATTTPTVPNQIVMFRGNDYMYANTTNATTDPKRIEVVKIQAPIVIESVAIYPGVDLADGVTLRYPSGNASNKKYLSVCSANVNMQDIAFQKITGGVVVDSTCASGGANVATSTLNSTIRSSIFFKSNRTGARRAVTILPTGALYAREVPDAWWPLDEGAGNVAGDISPNNYSGVVFPAGAPTWATIANSKFGGAYSFNGTGSSYVRIPGKFGNPGSATLMAWVNLTTMDTSGSEVFSLGDDLALRAAGNIPSTSNFPPNGFFCGVNLPTCGWPGSGSSAWKTTPTNTPTYPISYLLAGAGWHHIAYVYTAGPPIKQAFYVDGVLASNQADILIPIYYTGGADTYIGKHGNGSVQFDFNGAIDEVKLWRRALSTSEIQEAMNTPYH